MPYFVTGWVESRDGPPEQPPGRSAAWQGLFRLSPFLISGDGVSNALFGLAKAPRRDAIFSARGLPTDASPEAQTWFADSQRFLAEHGEAEVGHTYASWAEILTIDLPQAGCTVADSAWSRVFEILAILEQPTRSGFGAFHPQNLRVVAAANW